MSKTKITPARKADHKILINVIIIIIVMVERIFGRWWMMTIATVAFQGEEVSWVGFDGFDGAMLWFSLLLSCHALRPPMLFGLLLLLLFCPHALTSLPCFLYCCLIVAQCRVLDCISLPCTRFWVIWPHALKPSLSVFEETTPGGSFCRPGSFLAQFDKWPPA